MSFKETLDQLQTDIQSTAAAAGRDPKAIRLVAVSKTQPATRIAEAYDAGLRDFGENYLQEALVKMQALQALDIQWHFIGPIQSNKCAKIAAHFSWVHSVANLKVAEKLNQQRPEALGPLNICLQVNLQGEASKSGVAANAVGRLAKACLALPRLRLQGLMLIPIPNSNQEQQSAVFLELAALQQQLQQELGHPLNCLSMGMTEDWQAAIAAGSTLLRIGRGLFGERR